MRYNNASYNDSLYNDAVRLSKDDLTASITIEQVMNTFKTRYNVMPNKPINKSLLDSSITVSTISNFFRGTINVVSNYAGITVVSYDRSKISDETGFTVCSVTFTSDKDLLEWEARAGGTGHGTGLLVGSGSAETADTSIEFEVDYTELTEGDKTYTIYIYGRNSNGWSG